MPFIPHTEDDVTKMLDTIGASSIEELFDEIPSELRIESLDDIPEGLNEMEANRLMSDLAKKDQRDLCFIGGGAYEHHIPAAVWELTTRGEFMTAYTPYQAEASQGTLQLLYEYQTMMASLMGLEVSNASLYDGASALAEAVLMAVRANRKSKSRRILVAGTLHPHYINVVKSIVHNQKINIEILPYCQTQGITLADVLSPYENDDITALVIPQPNFFGAVEKVDELTAWAHAHQALAIAVVNPTAMALLKEPGAWADGVDIACGEGQPLGIPLASGGPYFGFMCCKQAIVRQMPGRIIGRTNDLDGKQGFSLTLQAREQHIRRSKATSNICTNQGLAVTAATIYMSLLGFSGLTDVAKSCYANTHYLAECLTDIDGVEQVFQQPYFHEVLLRLPCQVEPVLEQLAQQNIQGGIDVTEYFPELDNCLLICATETKTKQDCQQYVNCIKTILEARA